MTPELKQLPAGIIIPNTPDHLTREIDDSKAGAAWEKANQEAMKTPGIDLDESSGDILGRPKDLSTRALVAVLEAQKPEVDEPKRSKLIKLGLVMLQGYLVPRGLVPQINNES